MAVQHLKTAEFDAVVEAAPLAMVDFWADWCGPCKMITPTVEALAEQYGDRVVTGKVNVDEEPELARRFGIMSIPTVVFLKNGKEIERKVGVLPPGASGSSARLWRGLLRTYRNSAQSERCSSLCSACRRIAVDYSDSFLTRRW